MVELISRNTYIPQLARGASAMAYDDTKIPGTLKLQQIIRPNTASDLLMRYSDSVLPKALRPARIQAVQPHLTEGVTAPGGYPPIA